MRHYKRFYTFNLGPHMHVVLRRDLAAHVAPDDPVPPPPDDPIPPPPPDPIPPPEPDPIPPPAPDPVPPPPDDPIPPPPPDDYDFDELFWPGIVILVNAKTPKSHEGLWWVKVTDAKLDNWEIQDERHLDYTLYAKLQERRANVVFCLSVEGRWWDMIEAYVIRRGGIVVRD